MMILLTGGNQKNITQGRRHKLAFEKSRKTDEKNIQDVLSLAFG
jgi:hypothetical protein